MGGVHDLAWRGFVSASTALVQTPRGIDRRLATIPQDPEQDPNPWSPPTPLSRCYQNPCPPTLDLYLYLNL